MKVFAAQLTARFVARKLLRDLSPEEVRWLQRVLRGKTTAEWIAWRDKHWIKVAEFLGRYPDRLLDRERRSDYAPLIKLAAWQMCRESEFLFGQIDKRIKRKRRTALTMTGQMGVIVQELAVTRGVPVLWPYKLGSPFAK